ncbi:MAG TPA: hypothetical protein GXX30_03900 [Firmicutes bacterium]|nr:hypothetical protein [Candidatus Fermentithermobacillaceae bacterium]
MHPKAVIPATVVPFPGQWDGVPLGSEGGARRALATRVSGVDVEVRSLKVYEAVAAVAEG